MRLNKCRIGDYIKDVASGPFGSNLKVECFVPSGFPIIDGANLTGVRVTDNITKFVTEAKARSLSRSIAKRHDVIVTISGTLGQISYIPNDSKYEEYLCSQRQFRVTFDESKVCVEYLVNLLRTPYGQRKILAFANYVGVPALAQPIPNFKNIEVYLPDLPTQLRIAGVLGSIDEKIELNRKKIAELEALAKTIYDYWFVQFDFPDANGKPYKSSGGKMVWNEQLKREVPEGWEVGPILNISELKVGGTPSKKEVSYWNGNIPFWGPTDFKSGIFQFHTAETITNMGFEHCSSDMLNEDATIITARGSIGKVAMAGRSMAMNQSCFAFEAYNNCSPFVYHLARQLVAHLKNTSTGSVFNAFVASDLKNVFLLLGDSHVRRAYSELVQPMFDGIKAAVKTIDDLTGLRDSLLPLLMNGQVEMAG